MHVETNERCSTFKEPRHGTLKWSISAEQKIAKRCDRQAHGTSSSFSSIWSVFIFPSLPFPLHGKRRNPDEINGSGVRPSSMKSIAEAGLPDARRNSVMSLFMGGTQKKDISPEWLLLRNEKNSESQSQIAENGNHLVAHSTASPCTEVAGGSLGVDTWHLRRIYSSEMPWSLVLAKAIKFDKNWDSSFFSCLAAAKLWSRVCRGKQWCF